MKNNCILFVILVFFAFRSAHAQENGNNLASVMQGNAIIEEARKEVTIKDLDKVEVDYYFRITVFNEAGAAFANVSEYYDRLVKPADIDGNLYDATGKKIRSVKKSEIRDRPVFSEGTFVSDDRLRSHEFNHRSYPYTVEYTVHNEARNSFFLSPWMPVPGGGVAVKSSRFTVRVPAGYNLRYKLTGKMNEPAVSETAKSKTYQWELDYFPPTQREYASPAWQLVTPGVLIAPSEFRLEGYKGQMKEWKELGLFFNELNKGRDQLPESVRAEVKRIKEAAADRDNTIGELYRYLQRNTRYVGVQLGIGGWRPFPASYVAANGYGDCKALSNYMVALLKEAGIPATYALVRAGSDISDVDAAFPSANFNHVIVCVPGDTDTTWLECTSQTVAAGYLGDFTGNRNILLVTPDGGVLARTPVYSIDQNTRQRNVTAVLSADGTLKVKSSTSYRGLQQDELHGMLSALTKDKVYEYLQDQLDFPTYEVKDFGYDEFRAVVPEVSERLELEVSNYATMTGKRVFINPNIMTRFYRHPAAVKNRQFPVRLGEAYTDTDSVTIELPAGYKIEALPPVMEIDNGICSYSGRSTLKGNVLSYQRTLKYKGGNYPPAKFAEITELFDRIYKADRSRIVFVKAE